MVNCLVNLLRASSHTSAFIVHTSSFLYPFGGARARQRVGHRGGDIRADWLRARLGRDRAVERAIDPGLNSTGSASDNAAAPAPTAGAESATPVVRSGFWCSSKSS